MANERGIAGAIRSLVNARDLKLKCVGVLHESLLVPLLMYDIETKIRREKNRSGIMAVQMDNLRGLQGIRRIDRVLNA